MWWCWVLPQEGFCTVASLPYLPAPSEFVKYANVWVHGASTPNVPPKISNWKLSQAGEYGGRKVSCLSNKSSNLWLPYDEWTILLEPAKIPIYIWDILSLMENVFLKLGYSASRKYHLPNFIHFVHQHFPLSFKQTKLIFYHQPSQLILLFVSIFFTDNICLFFMFAGCCTWLYRCRVTTNILYHFFR